MRTLDPGHLYNLLELDGSTPNQYIQFVKRVGEKYPGNVDAYPGTIIQELCRVIIARGYYLDKQAECAENTLNIALARQILYNLEQRAARQQGTVFEPPLENIEDLVPCPTCGHIFEHEGH